MTWEAIGELDPHTKHPATEGASDPQRRVSDMDAMGVDQALLYPTWFAEGFFLVRDPDVAYALARAYNDWVTDFCKAAPKRLFAAAILPLQNMDFGLEELARVAAIPSVRAVFIRPMFLEDRYLNHPYYDPLWAELEQLGMTWRCMRLQGSGTRNGARMGHSSRRSKTVWRNRRFPVAVAVRSPAAAAAPVSRSRS
jgi:predicted TIM-barrel fold metal-dependent hydrolase